MNLVRSISHLSGIEAVSCAVDIEFRIADIQAFVIYVACQFCAMYMRFDPAVWLDVHADLRPILQVVTGELANHPSRYIG